MNPDRHGLQRTETTSALIHGLLGKLTVLNASGKRQRLAGYASKIGGDRKWDNVKVGQRLNQ